MSDMKITRPVEEDKDNIPNKVEVNLKQTFFSIICIELIPLVGGSVISLFGYNLFFVQHLTVGICLLIIGLILLIRNGIVIQFLKICRKKTTNCPLCCFKVNKERFWRHLIGGFEVPVVECASPFSLCKEIYYTRI